ncbi:hypothetical protein ACFP2T_39205 [Plantactinospora solaniradicis]|uniref:ATP-grasp domain-containing protein n=1 Tax=Plantactinospora solaniradicis TaxID=1723736 RepID=A0ABW1KMX5_9ACTN
MRAVLLGEYRAERLAVPLRQANADVVVLGSTDVRSCLAADVRFGELPVDATADRLVALLRGYDADIAIPNVTSPGQERMLPAYAGVARRWQRLGRRMLAHPSGFAALATDKVLFHETAHRRSWPVPEGVICHDPHVLAGSARRLGLPVIVKEARSESHSGRYLMNSLESLRRLSSEVTYPVLAQRVVAGVEVAVEVLSLPERTIVWPVASLGTLDERCAPGKRIRVMPADLPEWVRNSLAAVIRDMTDGYRPAGPWQLDLAISAGELLVIELNGRLGGLTNLSWLSTGADPHRSYVDATLGRPVVPPDLTHIALELPIPNGSRVPPVPPGLELRSFEGTATNRFPLLSGYYRAVLRVPGGEVNTARAWLSSLPPAALLADPAEAIAQLVQATRAWEKGRHSEPVR